MTNVSRRSIAKGAAWSVPAVVVGAPAAMAAASPNPKVVCPVGAALTDTGYKATTLASGTQTTTDTPSDIGMGTMVSIDAGMWQFGKPQAPGGGTADYVTGYRLSFPSNGTLTTVAGKQYSTPVTGGVTTAQVIGAGLSMSFRMQTTMPYATGAKAQNTPKGVSIPFTITYLDGLSPSGVGSCTYYINYTYDTPLGPAGNYQHTLYVANSGDTYSVTTSPTY